MVSMAIAGPSQPYNQQGPSIQNQRPTNLGGVIFSQNQDLNQQRVAAATRKKQLNDYNAAVADYNVRLAAYNKALKDQSDLRAQIQAQADDFNRRAAVGNISPGEFAQTQYAQDIVTKYGQQVGSNIVQAAYYDYLLQFPNPNYKLAGAANRSDLAYARASELQTVQSQLKVKQLAADFAQSNSRDQQLARQTLTSLSQKPVLTAADVPKLNAAYAVLGVARPDYTGTITRNDGTKEKYSNGMLVSVTNYPARQSNVAPVAQISQPKIPVISSPGELPQNFSGTVIINTPRATFPQQIVRYQGGRAVAAQPYFK